MTLEMVREKFLLFSVQNYDQVVQKDDGALHGNSKVEGLWDLPCRPTGKDFLSLWTPLESLLQLARGLHEDDEETGTQMATDIPAGLLFHAKWAHQQNTK